MRASRVLLRVLVIKGGELALRLVVITGALLLVAYAVGVLK